MAEKDATKELERIYIIPLMTAKRGPSSRAAPRAVTAVRNFLIKHMKVEGKNVWIDDSVNKELWMHGKYWVPGKIRVRAVKFDDGVVEVTVPELGEKKSRRELLKEEKEKKTPILKHEEEKPEEAASGAEGYEISPTAEGDVKIKKKKEKAPKEKKEETPKKKKEKPVKEEKSAEKKPAKKPKVSAETKKEPKASKKEEKPSTKRKSPAKKEKKTKE